MRGRPAADERSDQNVAEHAIALLARERSLRPITVGFLQAVCLQAFGIRVGERRAARMIRHLKTTGAIRIRWYYRSKKHGFTYPIYQLRSQARFSVRRKSSVKPRAWWQHGLFGNPQGGRPIGASEETVKRWRSAAFKALEFERAAV